MTSDKVKALLQTYTLLELLEMGGLDEVDALLLLYEAGELKLPEVLPL